MLLRCRDARIFRCDLYVWTSDCNAVDPREWLVTADDEPLPPGIYPSHLVEVMEKQIKQIESGGGRVVHEEMEKRLDGICKLLSDNSLEDATWAEAVKAFKSPIVPK